MEECGRGAAVEQLTARGMEYQSPRWGAIVNASYHIETPIVSIPAMGGNSDKAKLYNALNSINPRNGGQ